MSEEVRQDDPELPAETGKKREYEVGFCKPPVEYQFKPGNKASPGRPPGRTLMSVVREMLHTPNANVRQLEDCARDYIELLGKSFPHTKEYIDREEGKVPDKFEMETRVTGEVKISPSPDWFKCPPPDPAEQSSDSKAP